MKKLTEVKTMTKLQLCCYWKSFSFLAYVFVWRNLMKTAFPGHFTSKYY